MRPSIYTYKVTFEEVPYFYWGAHKERKCGETYLGSPKTHKWVWQFYTPNIQILEFFDNWEEALRVEKRMILPDLNNPWCLNEACGGNPSLSACMRGGKITGRASVVNGTGIHAPENKYKGVEVNRKNGTAVYDPEVKEKALKKLRKPVELTRLETGDVFTFESAHEAARVLDLNRGHICTMCRGEMQKHKGYTARYV